VALRISLVSIRSGLQRLSHGLHNLCWKWSRCGDMLGVQLDIATLSSLTKEWRQLTSHVSSDEQRPFILVYWFPEPTPFVVLFLSH